MGYMMWYAVSAETCMPESAIASFGFVDFCHGIPFHLGVIGNDHLANPFSIGYYKWLVTQVYKDDLYFTPEV